MPYLTAPSSQVLGITFMLFVTVSVLQLREVVHPDLLSLIIRPQEPHPGLLGSLLQESGRTHARRMTMSLVRLLGRRGARWEGGGMWGCPLGARSREADVQYALMCIRSSCVQISTSPFGCVLAKISHRAIFHIPQRSTTACPASCLSSPLDNNRGYTIFSVDLCHVPFSRSVFQKTSGCNATESISCHCY